MTAIRAGIDRTLNFFMNVPFSLAGFFGWIVWMPVGKINTLSSRSADGGSSTGAWPTVMN
jgi:hypothetical protein